jgi:hypothetical protein
MTAMVCDGDGESLYQSPRGGSAVTVKVIAPGSTIHPRNTA